MSTIGIKAPIKIYFRDEISYPSRIGITVLIGSDYKELAR